MRIALTTAATAVVMQAHAGLSLDQALARHRALNDSDEGRGEPFATLASPRDGLTPALGGPDEDIPHLLEPTLRGRGGARVVTTFGGADTRRSPSLRLGLNWNEGAQREASLDGSHVSLPTGPGVMYASVEPRHWGPGWAGSLILDAAAPALPAVGWRKTQAPAFETPWLAWLGAWNADVFAAKLAGHAEPADPYLIGMRVQFRPLPGLEVGASRTLQWGGAGRDQSWRSLFSALAGRDNGGNGDLSREPGNQLAGFDLRYSSTLAGGHGALYGQMVGEDEAGMAPSQWMAQFGAEWATRDLRVFIEWANLIAGDVTGNARHGSAYRHHIYRQGYTHDGLPLGHAAGGDVKLTSAGILFDRGRLATLVALHGGRAAITTQRFAPGAALAGLTAATSLEVERGNRIGLALWVWRADEQRSNALQAWWHTAWR